MRRRTFLILAVLSLAALGAGCSDGGDDISTAAETTAGGGGVTASLDIKVSAGEGAPVVERNLTCPPTSQDDEAACEALADPRLFTEPADGEICTQQYGGPDTATVTGTVDGEPVDANFSLVDGCEIARWGDAEALLGVPPTQQSPAELPSELENSNPGEPPVGGPPDIPPPDAVPES